MISIDFTLHVWRTPKQSIRNQRWSLKPPPPVSLSIDGSHTYPSIVFPARHRQPIHLLQIQCKQKYFCYCEISVFSSREKKSERALKSCCHRFGCAQHFNTSDVCTRARTRREWNNAHKLTMSTHSPHTNTDTHTPRTPNRWCFYLFFWFSFVLVIRVFT